MRQFLIVWFGQFVSSIGSGLTAFALGIYVFQLTGSTTHYSLMILAAFLPAFLLKPIGGVLSDRMQRKWLIIMGDLGAALGLIFILVCLKIGITALWVLYAGTIISSIFVALQNPAYKAAVTDLVDEKYYSKTSGLMQLSESARYLISPVVAGVLIHWTSIQVVLMVDCLTFLIAIGTAYAIKLNRVIQTSDQHWLADLTDGFKYTWNHTPLLILLAITSMITFFVGLLQALLGPMILALTNAQNLGISMSVSTTGMLISSAFLGLFSQSRNKVTTLSIALVFTGVFFALWGVSTHIVIITLCGFLFFCTLPFVNTSLDVLVRSNVDTTMQGRIWSIVSLISQLGMAIALGIAGFLADNIFNPLLQTNGLLASSVGVIIGTGEGRGIGLIFIISGIFVALIGVWIGRLRVLRELEGRQPISQS